MTDTKHLWEVDHPYYCSESNYCANGYVHSFDSWQDFCDVWGEADMDFNLVFRWDWAAPDKELGTTHHELRVFYMAQRKGLYQSCIIQVTPEDEEQVRAFLRPRLEHLMKLWSPLV